MSSINPGQIQVRTGTYSQDTMTVENDLIANAAIKPSVRKMLELKNKRYLMTLLTSGAVGEWGINSIKETKIPQVKKGSFSGNGYRFDVIGRIEKAAVIVSQIGVSGADGSFSLKMQDQYLFPAQVVSFSSGYQARVQGYPTGSSATGYIYNFKSVNGTAFVFSTHVGSTLTCFPLFTAYSEGSLRSDSRDKKPDSFINHPTIQRATAAITGSARADVLIYEWADGQQIGWMPTKVSQMNASFAQQDERHKWFSVSSWKNADGSLRSESSLGNDPETGLPISIGDGWVEQVSGTNTMVGSGVNGEATEDDFEDLCKQITLESNAQDGVTLIAITGLEGMANARRKAANVLANQSVTVFQNLNESKETGGGKLNAGYNIERINFGGSTIIFIVNPTMDDPAAFPARGNDGKLLMSSTYFVMGLSSSEERPTMEILAKEANGVNRSFVQAEFIGMTGKKGMVQSEVDADKVAVLKEDLFCVYNPQLCGIIYKGN